MSNELNIVSGVGGCSKSSTSNGTGKEVLEPEKDALKSNSAGAGMGHRWAGKVPDDYAGIL